MSAICWIRLTKRSRWSVERPVKIMIATRLPLSAHASHSSDRRGRSPRFFAVPREAPQIPWDAISGMRSKIVHEYMNVDEDIVWDSVTQELQPLIEDLKKIVPPERA